MAIVKAIEPSNWCKNCRLAFLRAFISSSGLSARRTLLPRHAYPRSRIFGISRCFVTSQLRRSEVVPQKVVQNPIIQEEDMVDEEPLAVTEVNPSTPWYLQIGTPQLTSKTLLDRQRLPELPPDPPPLLKPMLEHISVDLGLDDLTVFDLRNIDPPPALGANLVMVLGTARSEKHLHVSADRFCRWLKVTHKLSPYADGLLGRGELKLKLRRKARRARLLSNVGSSETGNTDDGLRTGWICVNVGTIEDGRNHAENYEVQEGYVGFGGGTAGAKVVIQMLTQEKREELDLEDLWSKTLRRHERKEGRISQGHELLSNQEVGQGSMSKKCPESNIRTSAFSRILKRSSMINSQPRQTDHRFFSTTVESSPTLHVDSEVAAFRNRLPLNARVKERMNEQIQITEKLRSHVDFVNKESRQHATELLGRDSWDQDSTTFLKSFYGVYPQPASPAQWTCRLALVSCGIWKGHPGYQKEHLKEIFNQMQASVHSISGSTFLLVFKTFLTPNPIKTAKKGWTSLTKESLCSAMLVLNAMHSHGHVIETPFASVPLTAAVRYAFTAHGKGRSADPDRLKQLFETLHVLLHQSSSYGPCMRLLIECCESLPISGDRLDVVKAVI